MKPKGRLSVSVPDNIDDNAYDEVGVDVLNHDALRLVFGCQRLRPG